MFLIISLIFLLLLIISLALFHSYHRSLLRQLTAAVASKHKSGSQSRLLTPADRADFQALTLEIDSLFDDLHKSNSLAQEEKKTLDRVISNIAHDIRTPLTVASGYTQQLLKTAGPQEATSLKKVATQLQVVSNRLEDLLEYRRLLEGAVRSELTTFDLSQLTTREILQYYDAFQKAGIELELDIDDKIEVLSDPTICQRFIQNLMSNILKHAKEEAHISLKLEDSFILLCFSNQLKQPIQRLERLTSRFYSENMSRSEESSGLGLYIIQQLVELIDGELLLEASEQDFTAIIKLKNHL
ncbi:sensor histidine kinase [Streptococcus oricebi]|uniref:histidine kinase n=1 Tax=Streptococcus oricebi TaxID=1547447 RepID=A0ABS5B2L0_9STRE|nr:sensor histidine kinase [Streptococcus oricebi]